MTRLSEDQALILARLSAGWRLQYHSMVIASWLAPDGTIERGPDMRALRGLWSGGNKLIELGPPIDTATGDLRYFTLTEAGKAVASTQGD